LNAIETLLNLFTKALKYRTKGLKLETVIKLIKSKAYLVPKFLNYLITQVMQLIYLLRVKKGQLWAILLGEVNLLTGS